MEDRFMKRFLSAMLLTCSLCFAPVMAAEGDGDPVPGQECVKGDKTGTYQEVKDPNAPAPPTYCDGTSCTRCTPPKVCLCVVEGDTYDTACPLSLSSPGRPVQLAMMVDRREIIQGWEMEVGFGPRRPLNYLARIKIDPAENEPALYMPARQSVMKFERKGNRAEYTPAFDAPVLYPDTILRQTGPSWELFFPDGRRWIFEKPDAGGHIYNITAMVDSLDRSVTFKYTEDRVVISDSVGQEYTCRLDAQRRIVGISAAGREWLYEYDGETVTEIAPNGRKDALTLDKRGRMLERTLDGGMKGGHESLRLTYDAGGSMTRAVEGSTALAVAESDQDGLLTRTITGDGIVRRFTFNDSMMRVANEYGRTAQSRHWRTPDRAGNLLQESDALGRMTKYTRDLNGRILRVDRPSGAYEEFSYDTRGNQIERKTSDGVWRYEYNTNNLLIRETRPDGAVVRHERDPETNFITQTIDPLGRITRFVRDRRGLVLEEFGPFEPGKPELKAIKCVYDDWGNRLSIEDQNGAKTTFVYDIMNNLLRQTDPLGHVTEYHYDGLGRKIAETDPIGAMTEWVYDDRGLVVEIKGSSVGGGTGCASCVRSSGTVDKPGKYEYNAMRLLTKYTDVLGGETRYGYDDLGYKVSEIDPLGRVMRFENDLAGNVLTQIAPNGAITRYTYTPDNQIASVTNSMGAVTKYKYDVEGRQTAVILADGTTRRTEYDAMGRVEKSIDAEGNATTYAYDMAGNMIRQTDALGVVTDYRYDEVGHRTAVVADADDKKETTRYAYDYAGRLLSTVNPAGEVTRFEYDINGRLTASITPLGHKTTHEYDEAGRRIRTTSPTGGIVQITYDTAGNVVSMHDGAAETLIRYDALGRMVWKQQSGLAAIKYEYDGAGDLLRMIQDGKEHRYVYDDAGFLSESFDPTDEVTKYAYDAVGRVVSVTDPVGNVTRHEYNELGQRVNTFLPNGHILESTYDANGRLSESRGGPDGIKKYEYDALGRRTAIVDALNRRQTTSYDALGRMIQIADEMNQLVKYEYDSAGRRTSLADANGNKTVWTYDKDGRTTGITFPNGDREEYQYDSDNRLIRKTTPNGERIRYEYSDAGHLTKADINGWVVTFIRDPRGNVLEERSPNTTMRYTYDSRGLMASVADTTLKAVLRYQYDAAGRRIRMAYELAEGFTTPAPLRYAYTAHGQLEKMWREDVAAANPDANPRAGSDAKHPLVMYTYGKTGLRTQMEYANGVVTNYTYHPTGNLAKITVTGPRHGIDGAVIPGSAGTGKVLASFEYSIDDTGNRTGLKLANGDTLTYQYDASYRLVREMRTNEGKQTVFDQTFEYDVAGNRTRSVKNGAESNYTYNEANQLIREVTTTPDAPAPTTKTYTYDKNGNMIRLEMQGGTEGFAPIQFTYDALNRPTQWLDGTNMEIIRYRGSTYHRLSTTRTTANQGGDDPTNPSVQYFVHDIDDVILDIDANHAFTEYVTPFLDQNILQQEYIAKLTNTVMGSDEKPALRYITHDALKSHRLATVETGRPFSAQDYTAFGESWPDDSDITDGYGYAGRAKSGIKGVYLNRHRMFSTSTSSFLQRDPFLYDPNPTGNLYVYANMNPTIHADPYGAGPVGYVYAWCKCMYQMIKWKNACQELIPPCNQAGMDIEEYIACLEQRNAGMVQCANQAQAMFEACIKAAGKF